MHCECAIRPLAIDHDREPTRDVGFFLNIEKMYEICWSKNELLREVNPVCVHAQRMSNAGVDDLECLVKGEVGRPWGMQSGEMQPQVRSNR